MYRQAWLLALAACGSSSHAPRDAPSPDALADAASDSRLPGTLDGLCDGQPGKPRVLVYSYENMWRHLSNWYARSAIFAMCQTRGFHVETTNDPHALTAARLANIDVVVFAVTSGAGLDRYAMDDYEAWVRAGCGTVDYEASMATEPLWPFYHQNLGGAFEAESPTNVQATVNLDPTHPITQGLPAITKIDQWYAFPSHPETQPTMHVLMTLDESTLPADYPPSQLLGYHPLAWTYEPFGGRVVYNAFGDQVDDFQDPTLIEIMGRSIEWAAHQL